MTRDAHLDAVALFAGLSDDELAQLAANADTVRLEPGAELFAEGDAGDGAYVITVGELEIVKQGVNREVLLAVQGPGSVIGEMALLGEGLRTASVIAETDLELLRIDYKALERVRRRDPKISAKLSMNIARILSERVQEMTHEQLREAAVAG